MKASRLRAASAVLAALATTVAATPALSGTAVAAAPVSAARQPRPPPGDQREHVRDPQHNRRERPLRHGHARRHRPGRLHRPAGLGRPWPAGILFGGRSGLAARAVAYRGQGYAVGDFDGDGRTDAAWIDHTEWDGKASVACVFVPSLKIQMYSEETSEMRSTGPFNLRCACLRGKIVACRKAILYLLGQPSEFGFFPAGTKYCFSLTCARNMSGSRT